VETLTPVLLLGLAGFAFGGAYSLYTGRKPVWVAVIVGLLGVLALVAGVMYL
jgi:4-hydroxybenzoate polyprenyltransferase